MNHPVANPDPDDFEPDGTWYSMVAVGGDLFAVEPNHQEIDRISPTTGGISRLIDISVSHPAPTNWVGPTAMTFGPDGALYVSNVGFGPPPNGLGQVLKITVP